MFVSLSCSPVSGKRTGRIITTASKKSAIESAQTGAGELTNFSEELPRVALWSIRWKSAELVYSESGKAGGWMTSVEGDIFGKGKKASQFHAQRGKASIQNRNLELAGDVVILTLNPPGTLKCNSVIWNPDTETIEARGKVYVSWESLQMGPYDRLIVSPDLKEISTPGLAAKK